MTTQFPESTSRLRQDSCFILLGLVSSFIITVNGRNMNTSKRCWVVHMVGFLDLLGVSMIITLTLTRTKELGASPVIAGLIGSLYGLLQLFSSPYAGRSGDKIGQKTALVVCFLVTACSYVLLGMSPWFILVVLSRITSGLFKHTQTLCKAYLALLDEQDAKSGLYAKFNAISGMGFIVGPAIGGHISELSHGFMWVCLFGASMFFLNAVIIGLWLPNDRQTPKSPERKSHDGKKEHSARFWSALWGENWEIFLIRFFLSFAPLLYRSNFTVLVNETLSLSGISLGYVVSFHALMSVFSGFLIDPISYLYRDGRKMLLHFVVLQGLALLALTYAWNIQSLVTCLVPFSLSNVGCRVIVTNMFVDRSRRSEVGAVLGMGQSISALSRMISPLMAGFLQEISLHGPGLVASLSSAVAMFVLLSCWPRLSGHHVKQQ